MFVRIVFFIIMLVLGIVILKYTVPIVRTFGKNDLAEKYLGLGGTYSMWKIIAVIAIIFGFLYMIGSFSFGGWDKLDLGDEKQKTQYQYEQ